MVSAKSHEVSKQWSRLMIPLKPYKDVDQLSVKWKDFLISPITVDDLDGKLAQTDPLFKAVGDLGTSVSGVQALLRSDPIAKGRPLLKTRDAFLAVAKQKATAKTPAAADVKPTTPTADKPK